MVQVWVLLASLLAAGTGAAFETANRSDYIVKAWDEALRSMGEPPLPAFIQNDSSVFRGMLYTYFDEKPAVFRIETFPDGRPARLTHIVLIGDNSQSQVRKQVRQRDLTVNELARFREAFARVKICAAPLKVENSLGSYTWMFEFANATRYCAIEREPESMNDPSDMLGRLLERFVR